MKRTSSVSSVEQRVHVGPLPAATNAGNQFPLPVDAEPSQLVVLRAGDDAPVHASGGRAASALFTDATVVSSVSATSVAENCSTSRQEEHGTLVGRQLLQRGDEGELDVLPPLVAVRRIVARGRDRAPATSGRSRRPRRGRGRRSTPASDPRTATGAAGAAASRRQAWVAMRYSHVRSELRPSNAASPRQAASSVSCRRVLRVLQRTEHPVAMRVQRLPMDRGKPRTHRRLRVEQRPGRPRPSRSRPSDFSSTSQVRRRRGVELIGRRRRNGVQPSETSGA